MHGLYHDGHSQGFESVHDAVPDLDCQPFLDLEPARVGLDNPGDLAEAGDLAVRNIRHVTFADEGQHMMLAHRIQFDILHQNHLLVLLVEDR